MCIRDRDRTEEFNALKAERDELVQQVAFLRSNQNTNTEIVGAPEPDLEPTPVVSAVSEEGPSLETQAMVDGLKRENRKLKSSISGFEDRNRSLQSELDTLETENQSLLASNEAEEDSDSEDEDAGLINGLALPSIGADGDSGDYNISYWILPFLLLGLGIAFYVVLREEFHKRPEERLASRRKD